MSILFIKQKIKNSSKLIRFAASIYNTIYYNNSYKYKGGGGINYHGKVLF